MVQYIKCFPRPLPTATGGGGGGGGGDGGESMKSSGFLTKEKTREELVLSMVTKSLGPERLATLSDAERAILGLPPTIAAAAVATAAVVVAATNGEQGAQARLV